MRYIEIQSVYIMAGLSINFYYFITLLHRVISAELKEAAMKYKITTFEHGGGRVITEMNNMQQIYMMVPLE